jgi:hypothetical protein
MCKKSLPHKEFNCSQLAFHSFVKTKKKLHVSKSFYCFALFATNTQKKTAKIVIRNAPRFLASPPHRREKYRFQFYSLSYSALTVQWKRKFVKSSEKKSAQQEKYEQDWRE